MEKLAERPCQERAPSLVSANDLRILSRSKHKEAKCIIYNWSRMTISAAMIKQGLICETWLKRLLTAIMVDLVLGNGQPIPQRATFQVKARLATEPRASVTPTLSPLQTSAFFRTSSVRKLMLPLISSNSSMMQELTLSKRALSETKSHVKWPRPISQASPRDSCRILTT